MIIKKYRDAKLGFFAGIAISESENRIYDIAKDKWLGKDFKYHSFYEYPSRIQTQKYGRPNNALKWQKILKNTGGVVNGYVIFNLLKQGYLDEVSNKTLLSELSSIGISELIKKCKGNVYSYAWSVGWELGRIITYTEWYQKEDFCLLILYGKINMVLLMMLILIYGCIF